MDKTFVFIDEEFIYKLNKHLGNGSPIKFDRVKFAKDLAEKEKLTCRNVYYYNAPPFQSEPSTKEEVLRKEGYNKFKKSLLRNKYVIIREGISNYLIKCCSNYIRLTKQDFKNALLIKRKQNEK